MRADEDTSGFAHETVTVDGTAGGVALTKATYAPQGEAGAVRALITLETGQIRYTYDGTAPTTTVGHLLDPGDTIVLDGAENISKWRGIRTGGTSGAAHVTYEH